MASLVLQNGSYTQTLSFTGSANETVDLTGLGVNSKSANGYLKLANGLILQWGQTSSLNDNTTYTITLPVAFPTSCASVTTTWMNNRGNYEANILNKGTSTFQILTHTTVASPVNWFAIGY